MSLGLTHSVSSGSIAAIASSISALVAIAALYIQGRRARTLLGIELIFKFNDRFTSEGFRRIRRAAANSVLGGSEETGDIDEVLDFFESLGLMMQKGALDPEMVWSEFFNWAYGWWRATEPYINEVRVDDPMIWAYYSQLRDSLVAVERKKNKGKSDWTLDWSSGDVKDFLNEEAKAPPDE